LFSARTISRRLRDGLGIRALTRPSLRRRSWIGGRAFSTMCGSAVQPSPKVGLMKLQPAPGEHRYAVAVREGSDLWLALWIRRSRKGEFFIMVPRGDRDWDVHTSYHLDGTLHMKSHGRKVLPPTKRQPLTGMFRGTEPLGAFFGLRAEKRRGDLRSGGLLRRSCRSWAFCASTGRRRGNSRPCGARLRSGNFPLDQHRPARGDS